MVDVPEHLLRRSRERRAALGLGGGTPGEGGEADTEAPSAPPPAAPPTTGEVAPAPLPAAAEALPVVVEEAPEPAATRPAAAAAVGGIPRWMMPVLVMLPLWALLYATTLQPASKSKALTPAQLGSTIFHGKGTCAGCHGGTGEGGVGPKLADGEVKLTFPTEADHIAWVKTGSQTKPKGTPYGDPARAGGQRVVQQGVMPAFEGTLTDAEIAAVVAYERSL